VDASFANDSTVIVAATPDKRLRVLRIWEKPIGADEAWRVPLDEVSHQLIELIEEWRPREVTFDAFAMMHAMLQIESVTGAHLLEYPQSAKRMVPACSQFAELVLRRELRHDHHPALSRHVANCHTKSDRYGVRVVKESRQSKRRIDAAVASIMAVDVALRLEPVVLPPKPKIY
jgi:phage terminase large subunit-like protein